MEYINNLFLSNPATYSIDISNKAISSIDSLLPKLACFEQLAELDLSNNCLTSFPPDLSPLKNLQCITITGNVFANYNDLLSSLMTLPKLTQLNINVEDKKNVKIILKSLPNLQLLNGQVVKKYDEKKKEEIELDMEYDEDFKKEFDIYNLITAYGDFNEQNLNELSIIITEYSNQITKPGLLKSELIFIKLKTRHNLLQLCSKAMVELEGDNDISKVWNKISEENSELFDALNGLLKNSKSDTIDSYKERLEELEMENEMNIKKLNEEIQLRFKENQELTQKFNKDTNQMADNFNKEREDIIIAHNREKEEIIARYNKEIDEILNEYQGKDIDMKQFKAYREKIRDDYISRERNPNLDAENRKESGHAFDKGSDKKENLVKDKVLTDSDRFLSEKIDNTSNPPQLKLRYMSIDILKRLNLSKALTLNQLKELIQDIYLQKKRYDDKCLENHLAKETMEQYMYTYLNQRYGLKSIVINWTKLILEGMAKYSGIDSEILLFDRVLRNECEEGFHFVMKRAKDDIMQILKKIIKSKRRLISEKDMKITLENMTKTPLSEDIWKKVMEEFCNPSDRIVMISKVMERAQNVREESGRGYSKKITFVELKNFVLKYVLVLHEINTSKFITAFKSLDNDNTGILDKDNFKELIKLLKVEIDTKFTEKLIVLLDPNMNQCITFSDCLSIFETEQIPISINNDSGINIRRRMTLLELVNENA